MPLLVIIQILREMPHVFAGIVLHTGEATGSGSHVDIREHICNAFAIEGDMSGTR